MTASNGFIVGLARVVTGSMPNPRAKLRSKITVNVGIANVRQRVNGQSKIIMYNFITLFGVISTANLSPN